MGAMNMSKIKNEIHTFYGRMPKMHVVFISLCRLLFLFSLVTAQDGKIALFSAVSFILTYFTFFLRVISKENSFLNKLNYRITTIICASSLVSCFVGQYLGVLQKFEEYDIIMSLATGINATLFGYFVTVALKKIENVRDIAFTASSALFMGGTIVFFREMLEFFSDYLFGTNFCHAEYITDDHWFFKVFGVGKGVPEQRPLYDTDEDMLVSLLFALFTTAGLFVYLRIRNKSLCEKKLKEKIKLKSIGLLIYEKCAYEIQLVKSQTAIYDPVIWWMVRGAMLMAIFNMEPTAERVKVMANLAGTFAITLLHFVFSKDSLFGKISYRVQTLVVILAFTSSYMGNYMFVYNLLPRFDLFLHFISGVLCVIAGYYFALTFFKADTKKNVILITVYAFCFSCFVIPFWEVTEFLGDFLFGSANQGFYWSPSDDSFFFTLFGRGVGNVVLYRLFDTVYDVLLAFFTTAVSAVLMFFYLGGRLKKNQSPVFANQKLTTNHIKEKTAVKY